MSRVARAVGELLKSLGIESVKVLRSGVVVRSLTLSVIDSWLIPVKRGSSRLVPSLNLNSLRFAISKGMSLLAVVRVLFPMTTLVMA